MYYTKILYSSNFQEFRKNKFMPFSKTGKMVRITQEGCFDENSGELIAEWKIPADNLEEFKTLLTALYFDDPKDCPPFTVYEIKSEKVITSNKFNEVLTLYKVVFMRAKRIGVYRFSGKVIEKLSGKSGQGLSIAKYLQEIGIFSKYNTSWELTNKAKEVLNSYTDYNNVKTDYSNGSTAENILPSPEPKTFRKLSTKEQIALGVEGYDKPVKKKKSK
jgi:hypothetical protein